MWIWDNKKKNMRKFGKRKSKINEARTREFKVSFQKEKIRERPQIKSYKIKGKSKKKFHEEKKKKNNKKE